MRLYAFPPPSMQLLHPTLSSFKTPHTLRQASTIYTLFPAPPVKDQPQFQGHITEFTISIGLSGMSSPFFIFSTVNFNFKAPFQISNIARPLRTLYITCPKLWLEAVPSFTSFISDHLPRFRSASSPSFYSFPKIKVLWWGRNHTLSPSYRDLRRLYLTSTPHQFNSLHFTSHFNLSFKTSSSSH